jgi:hypothetical protein
MVKTAYGDDDGEFKEALNFAFDEAMIVHEPTLAPIDAQGRPQTLIEFVHREDITEDVLSKLNVTTWPQIVYWKSRFVVKAEGVEPPPFRVQRILRKNGEIVYALWTPVPAPINSEDVAELIRVAQQGLPISGWRITYHAWDGHWCTCTKATCEVTSVGLFHPECQRLRKPKGDGTDVPNIQAVSDEEYCGFYPTIRGNDPAHWDPTKKGMDAWRGGSALLGQPDANGQRHPVTGREIRRGRREYREATKNYYDFDDGYFRDVDRIKAERQARRTAEFELAQERADKALPRKIGEV